MRFLLIAITIGAACWANLPLGRCIETLGAGETRPSDRAPAGGWKLADLQETMITLRGRPYNRGQRMFERAHCTKCHRFNNLGVEFGPDLAKLDPQFKPVDILRDILDPSRRIADAKYDLWVFATDSGRVVTGLIGKRTERTLEVMEKPPGEAPAVVLERSEIEERWMSLSSIMPRGLLDEFTRDEIADLVAYVAARGDPSDPLFRTRVHDDPPAATKTAAKSDANAPAPRLGVPSECCELLLQRTEYLRRRTSRQCRAAEKASKILRLPSGKVFRPRVGFLILPRNSETSMSRTWPNR